MKFSIITITRNNLPGLQKTLQSLTTQTCRDFEWVVIDGASTDGTPAFLNTTPLARFISEPDRGIYDAMNKGIDRAGGEKLIFLNAGDTLASADVLDRLARPAADFIYGDSWEEGHIKRARPARSILTGMITHHQAMVYDRAALAGLRYDTCLTIAADYKLTLQFLKKPGLSMQYVPFPICDFEPGGLSQQAVRLGRIEQFRARHNLKVCSLVTNVAIFAAQTGMMALRRHAPGLYWTLKRLK